MSFNCEQLGIGERITVAEPKGKNNFQILNAFNGNGDVYLILSSLEFEINKNDDLYVAFNNYCLNVQKLNQDNLQRMHYNVNVAKLKQNLDVVKIISDDNSYDFATKFIFTKTPESIKVKSINNSNEFAEVNTVRICYSGSRTDGLYGITQDFVNDLKHLSQTQQQLK